MPNNVTLASSLEKSNKPTVMSCSGGKLSFPLSLTSYDVSFCLNVSNPSSRILASNGRFKDAGWYIDGDKIIVQTAVSTTNTITDIRDGLDHIIRIVYNGGNITLYIDGLIEYHHTTGDISVSLQDPLRIMGYYLDSINATGHVCSLDIGNGDYITSSTWGDTTLSTGDGVDVVLTGEVNWWKKGVDQFFTDWMLYNSQLPTAPVEFQSVTRIDIYSPDTNDPLWGNYDENWLVVTDKSSGLATYTYRTNLKLNLALEL